MKTILLIRHGETTRHAKTFYGSTDVELSRIGEQQSQKIVHELACRRVQLVITTGLRRTDYCGELAKKHGLAHAVDRDLREVDFGSWEGMTWDEIKEVNPKEAEVWLCHPETMHFPDGENTMDFQRRAQRAWRRIVTRSETSIAIIAHSGVLSYLLQLTGECTEPIYLQYGEIIELHFDTLRFDSKNVTSTGYKAELL